MPPGSRNIDLVIAARYDGARAFQSAIADLEKVERKAATQRGRGMDALDVREAGGGSQNAEVLASRAREKAYLAEMEVRVAAKRRARGQLEAIEAAHTEAIQEDLARQQGAAIRENETRLALDNRYFAATHGRRAVELRLLEQHYARQRALHAGNAAMLARIDRTYAAERQSLLAAQGRAGLAGLLGPNSLVRRGASLAASQAAFSISPQLGLLQSLMASSGGSMAAGAAGGAGAAAAGVLAAPLAAAVLGLKAFNDSVRAAAESAKHAVELNRRLADDVRADRVLMGGEPEDAIDARRRAIADRSRDVDAVQPSSGMAWWNPYADERAHLLEVSQLGKEKEQRILAERDAELKAFQDRQPKVQAALAMERERLAVALDQAAAIEITTERLRAELEARQAFARAAASASVYQREGRAATSYDPELQRLAQQQAEETAELERRIAAQAAEQDRSDAHATAQARLALITDAGARELAQLRLQHQTELEERRRAGGDLSQLLARQGYELMAVQAQQATRRQEQQRAEQDALRGMTYAAAEAQAALIENTSERQRTQLALRHRQEQEAVRDQSSEIQSLLAAKQQAELEGLNRQLTRDRPIEAAGREALRFTAGSYFSGAVSAAGRPAANDPARQTAAGVDKTAKGMDRAVALLEQIASRIGLTVTQLEI